MEPYLFYLALCLNLVPVFSFTFFPGLDSPAHLYNSQLIGSLMVGDHATANDFHSLNPYLIPNWTGHAILAFFNLFLPAYIAEKILVLCYLVALPLLFRAILRKQSPKNAPFSYLVFPFTYSMVFCLGFYNFSVAIVIALYAIYLWMKRSDQTLTLRSVLLFFALITTCYFSHIFVFVVLIFSLACLIALHTLHGLIKSPTEGSAVLRLLRNKMILFFLSASLCLILFVRYLMQRPDYNDTVFASPEALKKWLFELTPLVGYNESQEIPYNRIFLYLLLSLLAVTVVYRAVKTIRPKMSPDQILLKLLNPLHTWLLVAIFMLVLYFTSPDMEAGAGYLSIRFLYMFYLFVALWLANIASPRWMAVATICVVVYCRYNTMAYHMDSISVMDKLATEYYKVGDLIEPNAVVLTVYANTSWCYGHFSNYLGTDKPIVILDNYECGNGYFPVVWDLQNMPKVLFGSTGNDSLRCLDWKVNEANKTRTIDYVFVSGEMKNLNENCRLYAEKNLESYDPIYSSNTCTLYRRK